jgi:23S rRNA pseudouridine955/2504/2580 synthase
MQHPDPSSTVQWLRIGPESQGQRIDNFLLRILKGVPKSKIYNILRKGEVRVNKGRIKPDYKLCEGDQVRIPPLRRSREDAPVTPSPELIARLRAAILHEDDELLVLNKPSGLAVHKGSGVRCGVIEALRAIYPYWPFLELAHRLDRDTSGCLVLAKQPAMLRDIHRALQSDDSQKRYLVLVRGQWQYGTHTVELSLRKNAIRGGERMVIVDQAGKRARSQFKPVNVHPVASLLEATISTGRTHQIRVHAASLGHPVAGDEKYGDPEFNKTLRTRCSLQRLYLHAHSLMLKLPGRELAVDAPLPDDLRAVLDNL